MKLLTKIKTLTLAVSLSLPACYLQAKTFDANLASKIADSSAQALHQVIVTFDGKGAPSLAQLDALTRLGINTGVSMQSLPIVGVLATKSQVDAIYARKDVISVWNNDELTLENFESTKITGVRGLRANSNLRHKGIPYSGRGVGVLINDSGIDGNHSDVLFPSHVKQNVLAQTNLLGGGGGFSPITYQENTANSDLGSGHGTHVAGTVGGNGAMSSGKHAGVAPGADLIGYGSGAVLLVLDTIGGFDYALKHKDQYNIRVISNSFGRASDIGADFNPDDPTNIASKDLADSGIITVFSAGNSGPTEHSITGNFKKAPWVITVAAGDKNGGLADFSSRGMYNGEVKEVVVDGETLVWEDRPTITAPGVDIISARASTSSLGALSAQDDAEMLEAQNLPFYTLSSGTSMSAPHVSGIVALMLEADPTLRWQDVKRILQQTATPMAGEDAWAAGGGYVNAHTAVNAAVNGEEVYGDTVKLNRQFNAEAIVVDGDSFTKSVLFIPVGQTPVETFMVGPEVSLISANATIETGKGFVLEDPNGNRYSSGIGLIQLGSYVGTFVRAVPGEWQVYASGIGGVSGLTLDPVGVTNGVSAPSSIDVDIRLLETQSINGIDDTVGHPVRPFAEYVVNRYLMDATANGFEPDSDLTRVQLADTLTLASSVRQSLNGNKAVFTDVNSNMAAAVNSVTQPGGRLADLDRTDDALMKTASASNFAANDKVQREALAYSLVQALGQQAAAQSFDTNEDVTVNVFGETVTLADSDDISDEFKGYVQLALAMGLLRADFSFEQALFTSEPTIVAKFNPQSTITRGETAVAITQLDGMR
ncbi:MAG: serine protease AprX [Paraglaciecola sp.]|jgi:serine protease AprX